MPTLSEADRQFLPALQALMAEYQFGPRETLHLLTGQPPRQKTGPQRQAKKTYRNPFSGHCIHVRAGKNLTYRAWISQYGKTTVESWLIEPI